MHGQTTDYAAILDWNDADARLAQAIERLPLAREVHQAEIGTFRLVTPTSQVLNAAASRLRA